MPSTPFDEIASGYDDEFTNTPIGRLQRRIVWDYLSAWMESKPAPKILELNCGTGADAAWLSKIGAEVLATDYSRQMVEVTREKLKDTNSKALVCDLQEIDKLEGYGPFDLIFSNFGGLNCIPASGLAGLGESARNLLKPGGDLIAVIMPRACIWETTYFLMKLKPKKAFRRRSRESVTANLGPSSVETWYHSPALVRKQFEGFRQIDLLPVGIAIPPGYLNPFFGKREGLLRRLSGIDQKLRKFKGLAAFSDHYLIHLKKES